MTAGKQKEELRRLMQKALIVFVYNDTITDKQIQEVATRFIARRKELNIDISYDDALYYFQTISGFEHNQLYIFFKDLSDEKRFTYLYNELYAKPTFREFLKTPVDFGSITGSEHDGGYFVTFNHPALGRYIGASTWAHRSAEGISVDKIIGQMPEKIDKNPLEPYVQIANDIPDKTAADAFFGEFSPVMAERAIQIKASPDWQDKAMPFIKKFREQGRKK